MNILFPPTCWTTTSAKSKNSSFLLKPIPSLPTFWNYIAILVWFPLLFWFLASPLYPKEGAIADSLIGITKLLLLDQRTTISGIIQNCLGILFGLQRYGIFFRFVLECSRIQSCQDLSSLYCGLLQSTLIWLYTYSRHCKLILLAHCFWSVLSYSSFRKCLYSRNWAFRRFTISTILSTLLRNTLSILWWYHGV